MLIDPAHDLAFSSVSIWELQIKWDRRFASGDRKLGVYPIDVLDGLRAVTIGALDLTPELAAAKLQFPLQHGDPFDTLLLTIAQETGRKLFTRDEKLRGHPLAFHAE